MNALLDPLEDVPIGRAAIGAQRVAEGLQVLGKVRFVRVVSQGKSVWVLGPSTRPHCAPRVHLVVKAKTQPGSDSLCPGSSKKGRRAGLAARSR